MKSTSQIMTVLVTRLVTQQETLLVIQPVTREISSKMGENGKEEVHTIKLVPHMLYQCSNPSCQK